MAMNSTVKIAAALAAGIVAYAVGGNLGDMTKGAFSGGGTATGASATQTLLSAEDAALQTKLEPFISCMNGVDSSMRKNFAGYKAEYDARVTGQDLIFSDFANFKIEVFERNNEMSKGCADSLEAAAAMAPAVPDLDAAAKNYATTLRTLIPVMNEADVYYDQDDFKDDAMAKGKELDAKMTPMFEALFVESDKMDAIITAENIRLRRAELTAMEAATGRDFDWHTGNVMFEARTVIDEIDAMANKGALTVAGLQKVEGVMQKAFDEATAYAAANPDVTTALGNKPLWFDIEGYVSSYLGDIKDLRRAVADNTADLSPQMQGVFDSFNDLVSGYNMMSNVRG